ncbi:CSN5 protein, partial [Pseudoatta argentina]
VLDENKLTQSKDLQKNFEIPQIVDCKFKLTYFHKFEDTTEALRITTALVNSKLSKSLKKTTVLVGDLIGARLISKAGSLTSLAKHPASTLFSVQRRHCSVLLNRRRPKYGLIYHSQLVGQFSNKNKGKISRMLAAKASLATRVDALEDSASFELDAEHTVKLEAQLRVLEEGNIRRISDTAKAKAIFEKYQVKNEYMQMAGPSSDQNNIAQKTWELSNCIETISTMDEIYRYDRKEQQDILTAKPWEKDPHFFKDIKISALALLKMVMHARSGGTLEVMGLLLGKVAANTMIVMDSFALPVEGTETRVNAQAQAYEYMTAYIEAAKQVGRLENAIGWYHSHPGYGCWLSGIDVSTQMLNQNFQEPFVAIVIDPVRTISAGKVCLGAFRTYPKGYKPANEEPSEYQTIPLNKIEDFGVHCKQYYSLEVSYFKSALDRRLLDSLWNKYWVNTLSSSSLLTNADYTTGQIFDLSDKLEHSESALGRGFVLGGTDPHDRSTVEKLIKATRDSCKTTIEVIHGLMAQIIKDRLFNHVGSNASCDSQQK